MSLLKAFLNVNSYTFTLVILIYACLAQLGVFSPLTTNVIFLLFLITSCTTLLIQLTERLPIRSNALIPLIRLADIVIVVFTVSYFTNLFPFEWSYIGYTLGMILLIYFAVQGICSMKDQADAKAINRQIQKNRDLNKSK